jgi:hypothetical protein
MRGSFLVIAVALLDCSGREQVIGAPIPVEKLAEAVAGAFCDSIEGCCAMAGFRFDGQECRRSQALWLDHYVRGVTMPPGVRYDAQVAAECVASLRTRACSRGATIDGAACRGVFVGLRHTGEACTHSAECARPPMGVRSCDFDGNGGSVCTVLPDVLVAPRGQLGNACLGSCEESPFAGAISRVCNVFASGSGAACYRGDGLYCSANLCTALEPIGAPCFDSITCVEGAYCSGGAILTPGTCSWLAGSGADCSPGVQCVRSTYCDGRTCQPRKAQGESCQSDVECSYSTCDLGRCAGAAPVLARVCRGEL